VYCVLPGSRLSNEYGEGALFIGAPYNQHPDDTDFSGALLMSVLSRGTDATSYCHVGAAKSLEVVERFWDNYLKIGRCTIDPEHQMHFIDQNRYRFSGDVRTCLWCDASQRKNLVPRHVIDESWITTT